MTKTEYAAYEGSILERAKASRLAHALTPRVPDIVDSMIALESGEMTEAEEIATYQTLADRGAAQWEGKIGATIRGLIEHGLIKSELKIAA